MAKKTYTSLVELERLRILRDKGKKHRIDALKLQIKGEEEPKIRKKLQQKLTKLTQKKTQSIWTISGGAPGLGKRHS